MRVWREGERVMNAKLLEKVEGGSSANAKGSVARGQGMAGLSEVCVLAALLPCFLLPGVFMGDGKTHHS